MNIKISKTKMKNIKKKYKQGISVKQLARYYKVTIYSIYTNLNSNYKKVRELWNKKNEKKIRKYITRFHKSWRGIYSKMKHNSKQYNREFNLSKEEFRNWFFKQEQKCIYCKRTLQEIKKQDKKLNIPIRRLTIDRKNNRKNYSLDNIGLSCFLCNSIIKRNFFTFKQMQRIGKFIRKNRIVLKKER